MVGGSWLGNWLLGICKTRGGGIRGQQGGDLKRLPEQHLQETARVLVRTFRLNFELLERSLRYEVSMSKKYAILVDVEGEFRILSLRSNASQRAIKALCRQMAGKLFAGHKLGVLQIEPWPLEKLSRQGFPSALTKTQLEGNWREREEFAPEFFTAPLSLR